MEYRRFGRTGLMVSPFCLGAMMFGSWGNQDPDECRRIVHRAIDAGVNMIDTADVYSSGESEEILGAILDPQIRDDIILATKGHFPMGTDINRQGNSRRWLSRAVDASLRRLNTDRIDLYQVHRPDPNTDLDETLGALTDLQRAGKIVYFGTSSFPPSVLVEARWVSDRRGHGVLASEQPSYSLVGRSIEREVLPTTEKLDMGVLTYAPLAGGWLSGRYRKGGAQPSSAREYRTPKRFDLNIPSNQRKLDAVERLARLAETSGLSLIHMALAFPVAHRAVTSTIIGPRTIEHLEGQLGAMELRLSDDILDAIDDIVAPGTSVDDFDYQYEPAHLSDARLRRR
jgi:aryl-alcohol dehydrogenase-like predicted oxidoreductase